MPQKPTSFSPVYNPTVSIGGLGRSYPMNPVYCLTPESADILAAILADLNPKIEMRDPQLDPPANNFHFSQTVPWLVFPDGTILNAGQTADYWRPRPDQDTGKLIPANFANAEKNCRLDIASAMDITRRFGFDIGV